jgi:hypothetical protein
LSRSFQANSIPDSIEQWFLVGHLCFFEALFARIEQFVLGYDEKQKRREALWYLLAEPHRPLPGTGETLAKESSRFWADVFRKLKRIKIETESEDEALNRVRRHGMRLIELLCSPSDRKDQAMFLVFDEAHDLTTTHLDGRTTGDPECRSRVSRFRMLRRSLRRIGEHGGDDSKYDERILPLFSIMTDTTSRLTNFQPHNDVNSSRKEITKSPGRKMFPPIIIMPTVDAGARDFLATCDPMEVQKPERLIAFGRIAWSVMNKGEKAMSIRKLRRLAISKLIRWDPGKLDSLYREYAEEKTAARKFLACLGPRLALQLGSFCHDTRELVASHMMCLEHVGPAHQLLARYISEPILAEASATATANHGWAVPLEFLLTKIQHGVVDSGFRGELVTKVVLCLAVEDAQQQLLKQKKSSIEDLKKPRTAGEDKSDEKESGEKEFGGDFPYSKPIKVRHFLNCLFRQTTLERRPDDSSEYDAKRGKVGPGGRKNATSKNEIPEPPAPESVPSKDGIPNPETTFSEWLHTRLAGGENDPNSDHLTGQLTDHSRAVLNGTIFFNHWIRANGPLSPSLLVKCWNRNAAIMCKTNATGADFAIPVMMEGSETRAAASQLGKCTRGTWTKRQQDAASEVLSYILIQTKNRFESTDPQRVKEMSYCAPVGNDLGTPNFVNHTPRNPYISLLLELHTKPARKRNVEMLWTRAAYADEVEGYKKKEIAAKATIPGVTKTQYTADRAEKAYKAAETHYNELKFQIPIVAFGLDELTYKCLENRPHTKAKLEQLLTMSLDAINRFNGGPVREELLESRVSGE